jgi:hypothetical protein
LYTGGEWREVESREAKVGKKRNKHRDAERGKAQPCVGENAIRYEKRKRDSQE